MYEKTTRRNGKWVKVTGKRGAWSVACGWEGQFKAQRVYTTNTKLHAETIAAGWLNDLAKNSC